MQRRTTAKPTGSVWTSHVKFVKALAFKVKRMGQMLVLLRKKLDEFKDRKSGVSDAEIEELESEVTEVLELRLGRTDE